jgi:hypothetical protein
MPDTVNVLGHQLNKSTVVTGAIVGTGALAYSLYKWEKEKKAAAASATTTTTPSAYGYGSQQYAYGYGAPNQYYGYGFGYGTTGAEENGGTWEYGYGEYGYGYYNSATGAYEGVGSGSTAGSNPPPSTATPTTNPEWVTAATSELVNEGYSGQTVSAALGAYILGQPLTSAQITIVQSAIGLAGDPPQSGTNGYPPAYKTTSGTTGGQGTQVTVPNVVGMKGEDARKTVQDLGLKSSQSPGVPKGKTSTVSTQSPKAGTKVNSGSTVTMKLKVT